MPKMNMYEGRSPGQLQDARGDILDAILIIRDAADALCKLANGSQASDEIHDAVRWADDARSDLRYDLTLIDEAMALTPEAQAELRACQAAATPQVL